MQLSAPTGRGAVCRPAAHLANVLLHFGGGPDIFLCSGNSAHIKTVRMLLGGVTMLLVALKEKVLSVLESEAPINRGKPVFKMMPET